jgi:hypothetical protein
MLGMSTKGYNVCFICMQQIHARYSVPLKKIVYDEFRMFLDELHPFRTELKNYFNGYVERRPCPTRMTTYDWAHTWNNYLASQSSTPHISYESVNQPLGMTKLNIFHELDYWTKLPVPHLLDPMHIFKNVTKSLIEHVVTKTKNIDKEREDLKLSNTKHLLWDRIPSERGRRVYHRAPYRIYHSRDKRAFFKRMSSIRTPSHFGALLANAFTKKDDRFSGLKSHDYYNILRFNLPLSIRGLVSYEVATSIFHLSRFARYLCMQHISPIIMANLEKEAAVVLVLLQMQFPGSFFNGQVHLLVHLPSELKFAGPVQNRWMFPIERYLKILKNFVRQKARPEGSIAEGHLQQEKIQKFIEKFGGLEAQNPQMWKEEPEDKKIGMLYYYLK